MEAKRNAFSPFDTKFYFYVCFKGFFLSLLGRGAGWLSERLEKNVIFLCSSFMCPAHMLRVKCKIKLGDLTQVVKDYLGLFCPSL